MKFIIMDRKEGYAATFDFGGTILDYYEMQKAEGSNYVKYRCSNSVKALEKITPETKAYNKESFISFTHEVTLVLLDLFFVVRQDLVDCDVTLGYFNSFAKALEFINAEEQNARIEPALMNQHKGFLVMVEASNYEAE